MRAAMTLRPDLDKSSVAWFARLSRGPAIVKASLEESQNETLPTSFMDDTAPKLKAVEPDFRPGIQMTATMPRANIKLDPASVRHSQRQPRGPALVRTELEKLEAVWASESAWRKSEALLKLPVWIARRKAMGSHR